MFLQECRDGKREGSVVSTQSADSLSKDERQAWRTIRKELEDIGISIAAFDANKDYIVNWLKTAISKGAFEELTPEEESRSISWGYDNVNHHLENPQRNSILSQPLVNEDNVS